MDDKNFPSHNGFKMLVVADSNIDLAFSAS